MLVTRLNIYVVQYFFFGHFTSLRIVTLNVALLSNGVEKDAGSRHD